MKYKFDQKALKEELKILAVSHWDPPKTIIEEIAENHGREYFGREHRVIFLPPYHPEYNGIELAWGRVKHYVGQNPSYKIKELIQETLPQAFLNVTAEKAQAIVNHIKKKIKNDAKLETDSAEIEARLQEYDEGM